MFLFLLRRPTPEQVNYEGTFGTVCTQRSDAFDDALADVACRSMGYTGGVKNVNYLFYNGWALQQVMSYIKCQGNETNLAQCEWAVDMNGCFDLVRPASQRTVTLPRLPLAFDVAPWMLRSWPVRARAARVSAVVCDRLTASRRQAPTLTCCHASRPTRPTPAGHSLAPGVAGLHCR